MHNVAKAIAVLETEKQHINLYHVVVDTSPALRLHNNLHRVCRAERHWEGYFC